MERLFSSLSALWRQWTTIQSKTASQDTNIASHSPFDTTAHGLHRMDLCRACDSLDFQLLRNKKGLSHLENIFELLETSINCRLCALLASHAKKRSGYPRLRNAIGSDMDPSGKIPMVVQLQDNGFLEFSGFQSGSIGLEVYSEYGMIITLSSDDLYLFSKSASLPRSKRLPDRLVRQNKDIADILHASVPTSCDCFADRHQFSINAAQPKPFLPQRVIDLKAFSETDKLVLRENTNTLRGCYAAVSHRWGGDIPFKTTRQNISGYTQGLDAVQLPQNFKDAIQVTQMLGLRYVWIDALCIVQDDFDDWIAQAKQMGSIYANASITLALHSPQKSTEGFLWRMQVPHWLEISTSAATKRGTPSFWLELPSLEFESIPMALRNSSIVQRAWCLQELWLSPRILHIVENQFIWRCPHSPTDLPGYEITIGTAPSADDTRASSECWYGLIEGYSSCFLTVSSDKLPAISGIHSQWPEPHINGSHCGHLGIDVHNGLLWHRMDPKQPLKQRRDRAPSWSWASVDGNISYLTLQCDSKFTITPDSGPITFKCRCNNKGAQYSHFTCVECHVIMHTVVGTGLTVGFPEKSKRFTFQLDEPSRVETLHFPPLQSQVRDDMVGWAVFDEFPVPKEFFYVRISTVSRGERVIGCCVLLVLKKKLNRCYRRVGIGYIFCLRILEGMERQKLAIA
jgi:hypothetical protein